MVLQPKVFEDSRGYFFESFNGRDFEEATGVKAAFVQDNVTYGKRGVLRGIHFQKTPYAQAKLVRVVKGRVLHVAVDLRRSSPTLGRHFSIELNEENKAMLYLPSYIGHGYVVLSDTAVTQYKCDEHYHPASEGGILWCDPDLAIDWQLPGQEIILSEHDKERPLFRDSYLFEL